MRGPPSRLLSPGAKKPSKTTSTRGRLGPRIVIGWREWVALPDLGIDKVKAKVDTGARTSVLHAEDLQFVRRGETRYVRFTIHPLQRTDAGAVRTIAELVGHRRVRSSNGASETRPVIRTSLAIGDETWPIELTLTSRDHMGFRMLIGRMALVKHALVDPSASYRAPLAVKAKEKAKGQGKGKAKGRGKGQGKTKATARGKRTVSARARTKRPT